MKTIYRYPINNYTGCNEVMIPHNAQILSVGISGEMQSGKPVISIWAVVDTDESLEKRYFTVIGTGADLDEFSYINSKFIGTITRKNIYAYHVFEYFPNNK